MGTIDLDGFAWYYKIINYNQFGGGTEEADEENEKNKAYGKHIIKNNSELASLF